MKKTTTKLSGTVSSELGKHSVIGKSRHKAEVTPFTNITKCFECISLAGVFSSVFATVWKLTQIDQKWRHLRECKQSDLKMAIKLHDLAMIDWHFSQSYLLIITQNYFPLILHQFIMLLKVPVPNYLYVQTR